MVAPVTVHKEERASNQIQVVGEGPDMKEAEEEIVWGAVVELEHLQESETVGLAVTRGTKPAAEVRGEDKNEMKHEERTEPTPPESQPAFSYDSKATDPQAADKMFKRILKVPVPDVTVNDLVSLSGELRKDLIEYTRTQRTPKDKSQPSSASLLAKTLQLDYSAPLREITVTLAGKKEEVGLLDEGSEIVVVRKDVWEELGFEVNSGIEMTMQTASGGREPMLGRAENLEIEVDGLKTLKTQAHAFIVPQAPFRLLLGRPWQTSVRLSKEEDHDGNVTVTVHDPKGIETPRRVQTKPRKGGSFVAKVVNLRKEEPNTTTLTSANPDFTDPPLPLSEFPLRSTDYYDHG